MKRSFTLIELIFTIVIIGILAVVAIPKFKNLTSHSKITSEIATASTIQSAIDDVHSDWIMSEGSFEWGNGETTNCATSDTSDDGDFNCTHGYPNALGDCPPAFNIILKSSSTVDTKWECKNNNDGTFYYKGPASKKDSGVNPSSDVSGKPDCSDYWKYDITKGTFELIDVTSQTCTSVNDL